MRVGRARTRVRSMLTFQYIRGSLCSAASAAATADQLKLQQRLELQYAAETSKL